MKPSDSLQSLSSHLLSPANVFAQARRPQAIQATADFDFLLRYHLLPVRRSSFDQQSGRWRGRQIQPSRLDPRCYSCLSAALLAVSSCDAADPALIHIVSSPFLGLDSSLAGLERHGGGACQEKEVGREKASVLLQLIICLYYYSLLLSSFLLLWREKSAIFREKL